MKEFIKKFDKIDIILIGAAAILLIVNIFCSVTVNNTLQAESKTISSANPDVSLTDGSPIPYYQDTDYMNQLDFLTETLCVGRGVLLSAYPARYFYLESVLWNMSGNASYREDGYIKLGSDCLGKLADNYFMFARETDAQTIANFKAEFNIEKDYIDSLTSDRLAMYMDLETDSYEKYLLQTRYDNRIYIIDRTIIRNDCGFDALMYRVVDEYVTYIIVFEVDADGVIQDYGVYR